MAGLGFDLQKMLHRKGEFESARLDDFAFRLRARTMRVLAETLQVDPNSLVTAISHGDDDTILDALIVSGHEPERVSAAYFTAHTVAEAALRAELGDPEPVRLG
jgi:hypothetical protein